MSDISNDHCGIAPEQAGGLLAIDLGALARNWRSLRDRARSAECSAVVKANAYGVGLEQASKALWDAGCRTFFVAHVSEGERARRVCRDATIYVLNGFLPGTGEVYARLNLRPVLGSIEEIKQWGALAATCDAPPPAVHVDTGMNRLGLSMAEALAASGAVAALDPALVMTHLVTAEDPGAPVNARQMEAFLAIREAFPNVPASLANSSGIFLPGAPHFELVRPGYALYGGNPTPGGPNPMEAVVRLEGRILQVRDVEDGEGAGYGAQWTARGRRRLATICVGYADGYPRAASGTDAKLADGHPTGVALVGGRRCPFAGRVSMDLIILDVSEAPEAALARGAPVTLIGDELDVDEVGRRAGTIGYEILTGLGRRYARVYRGG